MVEKNVTKTSSGGVINVCRNVTLTAKTFGDFAITCQATLSPFTCSAEPPAANALCVATTNTTTMTKTTTANGKGSALHITNGKGSGLHTTAYNLVKEASSYIKNM